MTVRITPDTNTPTASVELTIAQPLPDYDLEDVEKPTPRQVDEILVSQGFRDLVDDARAMLEAALEDAGLVLLQFTGAICPGEGLFRPGLWIVCEEKGAEHGAAMSAAARDRLTQLAELLRSRFGLS